MTKNNAYFFKKTQTSRISQLSFLIISSAFVGLTFRVNSVLGVRSLSFTIRSSLFMLQYSARSAISTNLSTSKISAGISFPRNLLQIGSSILSFVVAIT